MQRLKFSGLLAATALCTSLAAQTHLYSFEADAVNLLTGSINAPAGDVNADGYDDIAVAWYWDYSTSTTGDGLRVFSGRDGALLFAVRTQRGGAAAVAGAGDLDRDGYDDVAAAVFNWKTLKYEIWYVSGKTRKRMRTVVLPATKQERMNATALAAVGDVNRDGYADLLVGDSTYQWYGNGRVVVVSGKDGTILRDTKGPFQAWWFGAAIAGVGDVDRDGYDDFLVGDPSFGKRPPYQGIGKAWLFSGKTGKVIWTYTGPYQSSGTYVGNAVAGVGDVDGDTVPDYAIGVPGYKVKGMATAGAVFVFSGKTGKQIRALYGQTQYGGFGGWISSAGDWNRDGVPDIASSATGDSTKAYWAGAVYVYSGKDSKLLASIYGTKKWQGFGWGINLAGDLDGDKRPELMIGMVQFGQTKPRLLHKLEVWSPVRKALWTDTHKVSLAKQGTQQLRIDAGVKHAGSAYFVLGSMSGIKPGLKLGVHTLPLQVDSYFWLTATVPNAPFLQKSLGTLDSKGQATASFVAVPGMPKALIGKRADHAYILFSKGSITMTSNWVPLLFEK